jgi:hypothetical protein
MRKNCHIQGPIYLINLQPVEVTPHHPPGRHRRRGDGDFTSV